MLIFTAALLMSATVFAEGPKVNAERSPQETTVKTGVIFSEAVSERNGLCPRLARCWLPTPVDAADLEEKMPAYLRTAQEPGAVEISGKLQAYKRKYFGYTKEGERWISVVGLCARYWHRNSGTFQTGQRPMTDMGTCYFSVQYNVAKGRFVDLYIDGEA
jgi:hypothetical protein